MYSTNWNSKGIKGQVVLISQLSSPTQQNKDPLFGFFYLNQKYIHQLLTMSAAIRPVTRVYKTVQNTRYSLWIFYHGNQLGASINKISTQQIIGQIINTKMFLVPNLFRFLATRQHTEITQYLKKHSFYRKSTFHDG